MSPERIRLTYATDESDENEIPFRILVIGDFTRAGDRPELIERQPVPVTAKTLDEVMARLGVRLRIDLRDHLFPEKGKGTICADLKFASLSDFKPDALVSAIPEMAHLVSFKHRIERLKNKAVREFDPEVLDEKERSIFDFLFSSLSPEGEPVPVERLDLLISEIVQRLSRGMDDLLHHPDFEALASIWQSLDFLVKGLRPDQNCRIDLFDASRDEIEDDFEAAGEIFDSVLYGRIYVDEFGQYGGKPYGVILSDYEFGPGDADMRLLARFGRLGNICHAPFIAGLREDFFGTDDLSELAYFTDLPEQLAENLRYVKWRAFRETDDARYVGLVLPRFLLRSAYEFRKDGIRSFPYRERPYALWGNSAFAFGTCLLKSFAKYRWCLNIIGPDGGAVQGLRWLQDTGSAPRSGAGKPTIPTRVLISEKKEAQLAGAGLIPLVLHRSDDTAAFYSAYSVRRPKTGSSAFREPQPNEIIEAQLPYSFIVCRFAHYIKAIQRDNIGATKTRVELEKELNRWLIQYVSDMDNPAPGVRARRPLRKAKIEVYEIDSETQKVWYRMQLTIVPHLRYMGAAFSLTLQGRLGD